jgi:hypothetical protein
MLERESAGRDDAVWADASATAAKRTTITLTSGCFLRDIFKKFILILSR